ncbi:MAG: cyclic nucleotide-binding domain-containing protein [SAR324 cluster bacterium]|nr:cyclic nucleotide-binding domain-containing protein [SAR324 cluster bacterium]
MSQVPVSNYLKNTIPQFREQFLGLIHRIPLFAKAPDETLGVLFDYATLIHAKDRERIIKQGSFDQRIFILLNGKLNVLFKDADKESLVDTMKQPFTLFGERSLLADPRGASIESDGSTFLMSLDMAFLPDIIGGYESAERQVEDPLYQQNIDFYTMFSFVLIHRLETLEWEEYRYKQTISWVRDHFDFWKQYRTTIAPIQHFIAETQPLFTENLPAEWFATLTTSLSAKEKSHKLRELYMHLLRERTLGTIDKMDTNISQLLKYATLEENWDELSLEINNPLPEILTLSNFLKQLYQDIEATGLVSDHMRLPEFLDSLISRESIDPLGFSQVLTKRKWVSNRFSLAYVMFLFCKHCINAVSQANRRIVQMLKTIRKINGESADLLGTNHLDLIAEFGQLYELQQQSFEEEKQTGSEAETDELPDDLSQDDIEALFNSM